MFFRSRVSRRLVPVPVQAHRRTAHGVKATDAAGGMVAWARDGLPAAGPDGDDGVIA
ncbi:hypothetical protein OG840_14635 [Streptomyces sp. NBC_01764]|uniref:hypothetical protein n=1 Tax=Streptomyces sp. NBC_01764 TaxID=2975935 RepID=UPI0022509B82|nr:hypothetical protein [Streptomyces sp. NBC_01764]MCX4403042.1 hypothetical protein [Streptomyces sp. NBC_01764]